MYRQRISSDTTISYDEGVELIETSEVLRCFDAGHSMVYRLKSETYGFVTLISSSIGSSVVIFMGDS